MPNLTTNYGFNKPLVNNATDADLWGGQLNTNWDSLDALLLTATNAINPIGSITEFAGSAAPSLWLLCYGQTIGDVGSGADVENAGYETLFDLVKVAYGNAGTEVFASGNTVLLPDLRGRVTAGQDDMGGVSADRLTNQSGGVDGDVLGDAGGAEEDTLAQNNLPATLSLGFPTANVDDSETNNLASANLIGVGSQTNTFTNSGGGVAHNNVQPTIILNKIIYAGA